MSDIARYSAVALVVFLTHAQEGITGFGCTVLALPFITLLLGLDVAVPMLVIQSWVLTLYIVLVSRRQIVWAEYGRILALVAIGLPVGTWLARSVSEHYLRWALAVFMILAGTHGLVKEYVKPHSPVRMSERKRWLLSSFLPLGGAIHGAFGSGGPLIVIYAARALPDKSLFRVTLCMLWLTLNSVLIAQWAADARFNTHVMSIAALCLPFTIVGMVLGNKAHNRVDDMVFRRFIYGVLLAAGLALILSTVLA